MGLDLTLMPVDSMKVGYSHWVLPCHRREELFWRIQELPEQTRAPEGFRCYLAQGQESRHGVLSEDPMGNPLRYVRVAALLTLRDHPGVLDNPVNQGIWALLAALPADQAVVLYWC